MLQLERFNSLQTSLQVAFDGLQASIWTALPGEVISYNAAKGTVVIQVTVQLQVTNLDGSTNWITIAPLPDVPVVYMGGGGFVATFPIQAGDECLVIFSSRCIDNWWQSGGVQQQAEIRLHDISDGFAIIGPRSLANAIPGVSTTTAQLRSLDGSTYVEIAGGQVVNIVAPGGINIRGDLMVTGTVTASGEGTFNEIPVSTHLHGSPSMPTVPITGAPIP